MPRLFRSGCGKVVSTINLRTEIWMRKLVKVMMAVALLAVSMVVIPTLAPASSTYSALTPNCIYNMDTQKLSCTAKYVTPAHADTILSIHYDGIDFNGAAFTVVGNYCTGGGLPVPIGFNDRISSSVSYRCNMAFYDNTNYTGYSESWSGPGGFRHYTQNNRISSIIYQRAVIVM